MLPAPFVLAASARQYSTSETIHQAKLAAQLLHLADSSTPMQTVQ